MLEPQLQFPFAIPKWTTGRQEQLSSLTQTWFKLNPNSSITLNLFDHFSISSYHNSNSKPGHRDLMGKAKQCESSENWTGFLGCHKEMLSAEDRPP